jgi:hypothetical protein
MSGAGRWGSLSGMVGRSLGEALRMDIFRGAKEKTRR